MRGKGGLDAGQVAEDSAAERTREAGAELTDDDLITPIFFSKAVAEEGRADSTKGRFPK